MAWKIKEEIVLCYSQMHSRGKVLYVCYKKATKHVIIMSRVFSLNYNKIYRKIGTTEAGVEKGLDRTVAVEPAERYRSKETGRQVRLMY